MKGLLAVLCAVIVYVQCRVGERCQEQTQCDAGECCQILSAFPIMSRRQLEAITIEHLLHPSGTCELYKLENATCGSLEHANGYCGCAPGLRCHATEVKLEPIHQSVGRRSMIAPHPGYTWEIKCKPVTN